MTDGILGEIATLKEKATKFDNMKSRYVNHAEKLKKIISELTALLKEIDPLLTMSKVREGRLDLQTMANEFYTSCQGGTEINTDLIMKTHPNLNINQASIIMKKLREHKDVDERKEGRRIFVFCKREFR